MNEFTRIALVGIIVLVTHCLEGITGFGCTVLALPFIALLLGIKTAVPVLVVLAWILAAYIIMRSWKNIKWKEFLFIVINVGLGLPLGIVMFDYFSEHALKIILAIFMVFVGLYGLLHTRRNRTELLNGNIKAESRKTPLMRGILLLGGVIHGAFGTGGPFVVIYAAKALPNKTLFRVTICLLWLTLNTVLMIQWTAGGQIWNREIGANIACALPFLFGGMFLGDYLHHQVNEYYFKILVYLVLLSSGLVMGYSIY
jgi:hypothetical protein